LMQIRAWARPFFRVFSSPFFRFAFAFSPSNKLQKLRSRFNRNGPSAMMFGGDFCPSSSFATRLFPRFLIAFFFPGSYNAVFERFFSYHSTCSPLARCLCFSSQHFFADISNHCHSLMSCGLSSAFSSRPLFSSLSAACVTLARTMFSHLFFSSPFFFPSPSFTASCSISLGRL